MNKLVYLYELDSVNISKEEIEYAQRCMYEEILYHGNQVVLTFNQLTDSKVFLQVLHDKTTFAYERIIQKNSQSAVIVIPIYQEHFVFIRQSRHATRNYQLCFPRGFGEEGMKLVENARQELFEELGAKVSHTEVLGYMTPDSGMLSTRVAVVVAQLEGYVGECGHEGIASAESYTKQEVEQMLINGEIEDGFTLAAFGMYLTCNNLCETGMTMD